MSSKYSSATNPLGTHKLKAAYLVAANDFMIGLLNAHVILQQPNLDLSDLEPGLATSISTFQARMKMNASRVLTEFIPDFITALADGSNFSDLIAVAFSSAHVHHITNAYNDREAAQSANEIASAIGKQAGEIRVTIETLNDDYTVTYRDIHKYVSHYEDSMTQAIALLGSSVKGISEEIDALQKIISESLKEIVKGGDKVGEGITKLITGILTTIAGAPKDPTPKVDPKPKADPKPKDGPKTPEKPKLKNDSDDEDQAYDSDDDDDDDEVVTPATTPTPNADFVVNAIQVSVDGQTEASDALHALRTSNAKLADAYQKMAKENALMAMAKVIQVQNQLYLDGLVELGENAKALKHQWSAVESAYEEFSQQVGDVKERAEATELANTAQAAKSLWKSLGEKLDFVKDTLTGSL